MDLFQYLHLALLTGIFVVGAALMITRKLPALLVLPIMGAAIALSAWGVDALFRPKEVPLVDLGSDVLGGVIQGGASMLANAMMAAFFGGMISFIMQKSGVAENMVKQGAELIGDNPLAVGFFSMLLVALIFTTVGGLGAIIMVAIVVLPMLATVGVPPVVSGGILLIGLSMGGVMNPQNWALYVDAMGLTPQVVRQYALVVFTLMGYMGLVFVAVELMRARLIPKRKQAYMALIFGGILAACVLAILMATGLGAENAQEELQEAAGPSIKDYIFLTLRWIVAGILLVIFAWIGFDLLKRVKHWRKQVVRVNWYAYLIPAVPLTLIMVFDMAINAALALGFVYAILSTLRPGSVSLTVQSMIQGATAVLPAVLLMIGIGILLRSILGPAGWVAPVEDAQWPVIAVMGPVFENLTNILKNPIPFVLIFGICAPLALYRGPLNTWGLGFGVATLLLAPGLLPVAAIMAMLLTVGQVQSVCDPTNTHNVWIANEVRVDVQALMIKTLPYVWGMVFVGLTIAASVYFRG